MKTTTRENYIWAATRTAAYYQLQRRYLPASTTLAELQILTATWLDIYTHGHTSLKQITAQTGLSRYRCSRTLAKYIANKTLLEKAHPSDGRSRIITNTHASNQHARQWAAEYLAIHKAHPEP